MWATIWAAVGVVLLVGAFIRQDRLAYAAAALLKITWAAVYLIGWVFHDVYRGWAAALVWLLFAAITLIISTWPEPTWTPPLPGER